MQLRHCRHPRSGSPVHYFDEAATSQIPEIRTSVVNSFLLMIKFSLHILFLNLHSFRMSLLLSGSSSNPFEFLNDLYVGRDSSVGIATRYGLDGPGIESQWEVRFSTPVWTGPGAHPASYTMGTRSFRGVKRPGRGVDHPPPSSTKIKERVDVYFFPSGPSWPFLG